MRAARHLVVAGCLVPAALGAQADTAIRAVLERVRTPTSPAFTLLGVNPSAIARPSTPRALATELVSSTQRGTVIPDNYAAEFAPWWLVRRPASTFAEYANPGPWQSVKQSFSVSFATARADTTAGAATQVAAGARALVLPGTPSKRFNELVAEIVEVQREANRIAPRFIDAGDSLEAALADVARLRDALARASDAERPRVAEALAEARERVGKARADTGTHGGRLRLVSDSLTTLSRALGDEGSERLGNFLEVAVALSAAYADATFESGKFDRAGVWATFTRRVDAPRLDLIALLRLVRNLTAEEQNLVEAGGRVHWARGPLGLSSEWVTRTVIDESGTRAVPGGTQYTLTLTSSARLVGIVDYRARDDLYVTMSFGQDYEDVGVARHPLVARLGVQLAYGDKPALTQR